MSKDTDHAYNMPDVILFLPVGGAEGKHAGLVKVFEMTRIS